MSQADVTQALHDHLAADAPLAAALADRIYHLAVPGEATFPLLRYYVSGHRREGYFAGGDALAAKVVTELWASADEGANALAELVDLLAAALHDQPLELDGFTQARVSLIEHGPMSVQDRALRCVSTWRVRAT